MIAPDLHDYHEAINAIIELMPGSLWHDCHEVWGIAEDDAEQSRWFHGLVDKVLELAEVKENQLIGEHAICPICKRKPQQGYGIGFRYPEGLRRHLAGHGNVNQCLPMHALFVASIRKRR